MYHYRHNPYINPSLSWSSNMVLSINEHYHSITIFLSLSLLLGYIQTIGRLSLSKGSTAWSNNKCYLYDSHLSQSSRWVVSLTLVLQYFMNLSTHESTTKHKLSYLCSDIQVTTCFIPYLHSIVLIMNRILKLHMS